MEIQFDAPMSGLIIGNSGSGKTYLVRHLLKNSFKHSFDEIFIMCPTMELSEDYDFLKEEKKYKNRLYDKFDSEIISEIMAEQKYIKKKYGKERLPQVLILLDDCLEFLEGNKNIVNVLFFKGRHFNISCLCLVQRMKGIGTILRLNTRFVVFFRSANSSEQENVLEEYTGKKERKTIEAELQEWFKNPFSFLVCDLKTQDFSKRFALGKDCKIERFIEY